MVRCVSVFQAQPVEQAAPIGSPPAFSGPIIISPASMPPAGAAFIHQEIERTALAPGK